MEELKAYKYRVCQYMPFVCHAGPVPDLNRRPEGIEALHSGLQSAGTTDE
jgi:hypothetical protein